MDKWLNRLININRITTVASGVCGIGIWWIFINNLPPQIPLWYSRPWGESQLASPRWLLLIPAIILGVGIATELAVKILKIETILKLMVLTAVGLSQLIMVIGLLRIIWIVL